MRDSGIQWTTHTFNPWVGCQRVSPGCENCYAETRDKRFHAGQHWGPGGTNIENRTWAPPESLIGERIAIHAGKMPVSGAAPALAREVVRLAAGVAEYEEIEAVAKGKLAAIDSALVPLGVRAIGRPRDETIREVLAEATRLREALADARDLFSAIMSAQVLSVYGPTGVTWTREIEAHERAALRTLLDAAGGADVR